MVGFRAICVVDMDTIDVSNLNRQFLFQDKDVGRFKAEVAAECVNTRFRPLGVHVDHRSCRIEELDDSFFGQFFIIMGGLDSISARRWLNSTVFNLVVRDPISGEVIPSSIRFLIDGGSEGFKGQARVIVPFMTACFECTMDTFPPVTTYPLCTIAETPRLPEHCIEYAVTVEWEKSFPSEKFNPDTSTHLEWVFEKALERARKFDIEGVTPLFTESVIKRIVPAVASTNAFISALMVNEAFKLVTCTNPVMDNYFMYMGSCGVNAETISYRRNPDCLVCADGNNLMHVIHCSPSDTLRDLLNVLTDLRGTFRLDNPSITSGGHPLYVRNIFQSRLDEPLRGMTEGLTTTLVVTDVSLAGRHVLVRIEYS